MTIFHTQNRAAGAAAMLLLALATCQGERKEAAPTREAAPTARTDTGGWDVIVVGAGLAGLSAAHALPEARVLVLERSDRPGGRAATREKDGVWWEQGALVPPLQEASILGFEPPRVLETPRRLGIAFGRTVTFGATLLAAAPALSPDAREGLAAFAAGDLEDPTALPETARAVVEAAARLLQPTDLTEIPAHEARWSLQGLPGIAWAGGYATLVDHLALPLGDRLRTGAEVTQVLPEGDRVRVRWRRNGATEEATARAVILAVPAPAVPALLSPLTEGAAAGLAAIGFANCMTATLGLRDLDWPSFTAIYIIGRKANAVLRHPGPPQNRVTVLHVYYGDAEFREFEGLDDATVLADALETLRSLDLGPISEDAVVIRDLRRWAPAVPYHRRSAAARLSWAERARAAPRVLLAGDYVGAPGDDGFGTDTAIKSGRAAATAVQEILDSER